MPSNITDHSKNPPTHEDSSNQNRDSSLAPTEHATFSSLNLNEPSAPVTVYKVLNISSAHQLSLPYESKCNRLHGHNWKVEVWVTGSLNEENMVLDFNHIKQEVMQLDHVTINDFVSPPTAESLAIYFVHRLFTIAENNVRTIKTRVWETPTSYAEYQLTRPQ